MIFQYNLPVNLLFGRHGVEKLGETASAYGHRAMLVTGTSSIRKSGLLDRVEASLKRAEIAYFLFDRVKQNPLTTTAQEGAALAKEEKCDIVIGIGGGSIMDCAKAIAFLAVNEGDINAYIYGRAFSDKALPLVLVPTTCGTGSEGNGFAVLTNPENGDKKSLRTNAIIAKASIIDSELMETMPKHILSSVGFDALCHCMEAYVSAITNPLIEAMSVKGMELIAEALPALVKDQYEKGSEKQAELWDHMSAASTMGGMVIHSAGVVLPHAMEHPASGLKNIVHGRGLAALTPVIVQASCNGAPEKYARISEILGGRDERDCADQIRKFLSEIGLETTLSEQGITGADIPWMSENCLKVSAAGVKNHPVQFNQKGIAALYEQAL